MSKSLRSVSEISSNRKNAKIRNRLLKNLVLITFVIAFYSYSVPFLHAKDNQI